MGAIKMMKIKIVKVVHPEITGCMTMNGEYIQDYACPVCGNGVGEGEKFCSCCGNELDWTGMSAMSKKLKKMIDSL